jgi:hypothetical protein
MDEILGGPNPMKIIKIFLIVIALTFIGALGVSAQPDTYRASVERLLLLTRQNEIVDQMFQQLKQIQLQQLQQMNIPQDKLPLAEKYLNKIYDVMEEEMGWEKMKEDFVGIYMSVYTEQEIRELIAFYESPLGRKVTEKMPLLMQQTSQISQKYFQRLMPRILSISEEMAKEIGGGAK